MSQSYPYEDLEVPETLPQKRSPQRSPLDDLQRPADVAEKYPHLFTKWGLIRECRAAEFNGMAEQGVVLKYKNKTYVNVPRLFKWLDSRYGLKSA